MSKFCYLLSYKLLNGNVWDYIWGVEKTWTKMFVVELNFEETLKVFGFIWYFISTEIQIYHQRVWNSQKS